jgi:CMP-N-acetylneuraminic acid synthetase
MNKKIVFFLPTRKGSERVIEKNTREFAGIKGGILKLKIQQILDLELPYDIIVSTNDEKTKELANNFNDDRIKVIDRPEELCLSSTNITDFINYIPTIIPEGHVFWLHATAPFVTTKTYLDAIEKYQNLAENFDSLISVNKIQQFIWNPETNECINHDRSKLKWPRTQDLKPLYEINHAFYINSVENYIRLNDRIGEKPYYYELNKLESFDIDWDEDFKVAELIYSSLYATK